MSGSLGGGEITISGSGFDDSDCMRNKVTLAGQICRVTACTWDKLVCTIGPQPSSSVPHGPAGSRWFAVDVAHGGGRGRPAALRL